MALEAVDTFVITLELVYRELTAREQLDGFNADVAEACDLRYQDEQLPTHESHTPPLLHTGCVGRPKFEILCAQIEFNCGVPGRGPAGLPERHTPPQQGAAPRAGHEPARTVHQRQGE